MDPQSIRHLHALRNFIRNLVEQAERSDGCECHRPPSLLLVGPPGVGKTYLVKQMSNVCEMPLYGVHTHQLGGPKALKSLFKQAREIDYPSLFFLDDIDSIFRDHDINTDPDPMVVSLRQELYRQLRTRKLKILDPDSVHNPMKDPTIDSQETDHDSSFDNNGIILVAATSSPWQLYKDHELLSRFRGVYLVGLPDKETRFHLIKNLLQKVQHNLTEKDIWVVADKTEGFTPSDLMLVTKALNYKQFAFLISLAGGMDGLEGSTDGESMTSSEETESEEEEESDSDQTEEANMSDSKGNSTMTSGIRQLSSCSSESSISQDANTVAIVEKDWASDEDVVQDRRKLKAAFSSTPKKECGKTLLALPIVTDDLNESQEEELKEISDALNDLDEACGVESPSCDNINLDNNSIQRNTPSPSEKQETPEKSATMNEAVVVADDSVVVADDSFVAENSLVVADKSVVVAADKSVVVAADKSVVVADNSDVFADDSDDTKAFELHLYEPPNPLRDDNQAIDSGSDSDKEDNSYVRRSRRVNFSDSNSMQPLSVDVERSDSTRSYSPTAPMGNDLAKSLYGAVASSNILKCLLAQSGNEQNDLNLKSQLSSSKDKDDSHNSDNFLGLYGQVEESDSSDLCRNLDNALKSNSSLGFQLGLSVAGIVGDLVDKSCANGPSSTQLSPTGSDSSGRLTPHNDYDNQRDVRLVDSNSRDSGINKTRDSDSPPTIPSSDISTATCNVSECHSDVEDRFRNLDEDLKVGLKTRGDNEEDDESAEEVDDDLRAIFSLNNLGDVTIKIITLDDVLTAVRQTQRSVSDEEIKKYTDFMLWFANVAKSACPHNAKNSTRGSSSDLSLSLDSTDCSQNRSMKKRKGALKKLGRFLLKALMLLLD